MRHTIKIINLVCETVALILGSIFFTIAIAQMLSRPYASPPVHATPTPAPTLTPGIVATQVTWKLASDGSSTYTEKAIPQLIALDTPKPIPTPQPIGALSLLPETTEPLAIISPVSTAAPTSAILAQKPKPRPSPYSLATPAGLAVSTPAAITPSLSPEIIPIRRPVLKSEEEIQGPVATPVRALRSEETPFPGDPLDDRPVLPTTLPGPENPAGDEITTSSDQPSEDEPTPEPTKKPKRRRRRH